MQNSDYKIYPIADNDTPKLSGDRLEYTLSGGLYQVRIFDIEQIKKYYNNIIISKNEDGIEELAFKDKEICEDFIHKVSNLWPHWIEDECRVCMQFIADIVKAMYKKGYITIDNLYKFLEKEIIDKIKNCEDLYIRNASINFEQAQRNLVYKSEEANNEIYCTSVKGKKRYINPLVINCQNVSRIKEISEIANKDINDLLNMKMHTYIGLNFEFKPY